MNGIGLALGGGGVKGFFHIGVLRVLEAEKIPIAAICGTSMGAIIGGLYCVDPDIRKLEDMLFGLMKRWEIKQLSQPAKNILPFDLKKYWTLRKMERRLKITLPSCDISQTKIPFAVIASDIGKGEKVVIKDGPIRDAIIASANIPGVLPPFRVGDKYLVDGGIYDNVPVFDTRGLGAKKVLAVHVTSDVHFSQPPKTRLEVILRGFLCMLGSASRGSSSEADLLLKPNLDMIPYADFGYASLCADMGEAAAKENLKKIKDLAGSAGFPFWKK